jgi:5'-nucleotidase
VTGIFAAGDVADDGPGTDFGAVRDGYVSVTPLQIDLTRKDSIAPVAQWLEHLTP